MKIGQTTDKEVSTTSVQVESDASVWSYVEPYKGHIVPPYTEKEISGYRWVHNPPISADGKPQLMQAEGKVTNLMVPGENAKPTEWLEFGENFTLSNHDTLEHSLAAYKGLVERFRAKTIAPEAIEKIVESFKHNKGDHVVKINYTPDTAIVGPIDKNGHFNAILKEGVDWRSLIDSDFEPLKIEI